MKYFRLGKSDLNVSRICMGCMGFGDAGQGQHAWTLDEEHSRQIIKRGLELGALSGRYDTKHPMPEGSARAATYNPVLDKLGVLNAELKRLADKYGVGPAQIPVAWAIAKGTLPIIGVTKVRHVEDAVKAANVALTEEETKGLEKLADSLGINAIRFWEKEMK